MEVKELINELKKYKSDLEIMAYSGIYLSKLFEVEEIKIQRFEKRPKKVLCLYFSIEPDTLLVKEKG